MIEDEKMTEAGLAKIRKAKERGEWSKAPVGKEPVMPPDFERALAANKMALENFNNLAKSYKIQFVGWISSGKREETRKKRIAEAVGLLERNKKLGMK